MLIGHTQSLLHDSSSEAYKPNTNRQSHRILLEHCINSLEACNVEILDAMRILPECCVLSDIKQKLQQELLRAMRQYIRLLQLMTI